MKVRILGSAAGGGLPQWNCGCTNCVRARAGDAAVPPRSQPSIAVSADGERWSEGSRTDEVFVPAVAPGSWYLRIEPETRMPVLHFHVAVDHDVPRIAFFSWALALLVVPYAVLLFRSRAFEYERWQQSDDRRASGTVQDHGTRNKETRS